MFTVIKQYRDFPAAHRQPNHDGHCRLIHGHNWGWDVVFACDQLDENGFVVDVGKLGEVKKSLTELFDHTLLLNLDDPHLRGLQNYLAVSETVVPGGVSSKPVFARIVTVPNCGMEGLAKVVYDLITAMIDQGHFDEAFSRNLRVARVTCWEDSKNSATYEKP